MIVDGQDILISIFLMYLCGGEGGGGMTWGREWNHSCGLDPSLSQFSPLLPHLQLIGGGSGSAAMASQLVALLVACVGGGKVGWWLGRLGGVLTIAS